MALQTYVVGGAVRDALLGLPIKDRDYVVVGSTVDEMLSLGFKPVGKDFPVFLHPQTHEEFALARTERKTSMGYKGFTVHASPHVTLQEDLARRDLTINAIAQDADGNLIDPFNGLADIQAKILRHVSDAFIEDPVRILRTARFAARFTRFTVASQTNALMQTMVRNGEVDALVPERVWQELAIGLMEVKPSRMFEVLRACDALQKILPELNALWGVPQTAIYHPEIDTGVHVMMVIDYAAKAKYSLAVRFAALMHDLGKGKTPKDIWPRHIGHEERSVALVKEVCVRLKVPNECKELALMVAKFHGKLHQAPQMKPATLLTFLMELDAIRQPARFEDFLKACEADARGRLGLEQCEVVALPLMRQALITVLEVDAGEIAKTCASPQQIKEAIYAARLASLASTNAG
jgi:tRNA nucleotidyltransferase (CCA-adding enzyme)